MAFLDPSRETLPLLETFMRLITTDDDRRGTLDASSSSD